MGRRSGWVVAGATGPTGPNGHGGSGARVRKPAISPKPTALPLYLHTRYLPVRDYRGLRTIRPNLEDVVRITRSLRIVGVAVVAAAAATGATATAGYAETPTKTVASVHAHVDARATHITAKMVALKPRVVANKRFTAAAKAVLNADIAKLTADTATWRKQIDAATTMVAIKAAAPAQKAVLADLAKLHTDLTAARATKVTAH
jgi:hypothetical protein